MSIKKAIKAISEINYLLESAYGDIDETIPTLKIRTCGIFFSVYYMGFIVYEAETCDEFSKKEYLYLISDSILDSYVLDEKAKDVFIQLRAK